MVRINKSFIIFCVVCLVIALGVGAIFFTRMSGGEKMAAVDAKESMVTVGETELVVDDRTLTIPLVKGDASEIDSLNEMIRNRIINAEGWVVTDVDFEHQTYKGMLTILMRMHEEEPGAQGRTDYKVFYYDIENKRTLDLIGYLEAFDLTYEQVLEKLHTNEEFLNRHGHDETMQAMLVWDVIVSKSYATVWYNDDTSMNGYSYVQIDELAGGN